MFILLYSIGYLAIIKNGGCRRFGDGRAGVVTVAETSPITLCKYQRIVNSPSFRKERAVSFLLNRIKIRKYMVAKISFKRTQEKFHYLKYTIPLNIYVYMFIETLRNWFRASPVPIPL